MDRLRKIHWFLSQQLGIDLRRMLAMPCGLMRYVRDLMRFRRVNSMRLQLQPCLHDWWEQAGALDNEYFWQDLFVARMVYRAQPTVHVDVGSRMDGFVAHLAAFRDVEVFDIRPLDFRIPGIVFRQADMMNASELPPGYADSVSCLHAIEHFGLGRYGDPLAADGVERGIKSLAKILKPDGVLYLSCPCGDDVVYFNAHRSLHPYSVEKLAGMFDLKLQRCWLFDATKKSFDEVVVSSEGANIGRDNSLAIFVFRKNATPELP